MPRVLLAHRILLLVEGEDATHFLEGLITSELPADGEARGSALLTPQGKLLFTFLVCRRDSGFMLECDASDLDALTKRLTLYKLRAKVTLSLSDTPVFAVWETSSTQGLNDTRHPQMGTRHYGQVDATDTVETYDSHRAALGVLEGPTEVIPNQDFPHDVALDLTGAVSFSKGCFVGQEVVSRVKHRGTSRRRPVCVSGAGLQVGQSVVVGEREIGTIRLVADERAVAVVRIDQLRGPATVDGNPIDLAVPPYAKYSLESVSGSEAD